MNIHKKLFTLTSNQKHKLNQEAYFAFKLANIFNFNILLISKKYLFTGGEIEIRDSEKKNCHS
jgi:hypothetical protein